MDTFLLYMIAIDYWLVALFFYVAILLWTFRPTYKALQQKIELNPGGETFKDSPYFSDESKKALQQHYSRIQGTLGYWKNRAAYYESLHLYCLLWTIPSAVLIPILTNGISEGNFSKLFVTRLVALKNQLVRQIKVPHPRANAKQFIIKINSMYS